MARAAVVRIMSGTAVRAVAMLGHAHILMARPVGTVAAGRLPGLMLFDMGGDIHGATLRARTR